MYEIHFDNTIKKIYSKIELIEFLKEEKEIFSSFWHINNSKNLLKVNGRCFGSNIRSYLLNIYNELLEEVYNNKLTTEKFSALYENEKIIYSNSNLGKKIKSYKEKKFHKVSIYILGLITQLIDSEEEVDIEILELANNELKQYKNTKKEYKPYRVLAIDGGGIQGYYEASLLYALEKYFNKVDIGKSFNMICGTSTGAILASGLAKGIPLSEIRALYKNNAKSIFPRPTPNGGIALLFWIFRHLKKPTSSQKILFDLLEKTFGEMTLSEIWQTRKIALCIPSLYVNMHKPWIFKTPHGNINSQYKDLKIKDVCLASSAAPIFFPLAKLNSNEYYTDGGLWANNPILIGLSEALKLADKNQPIEIYSLTPPVNNEADTKFYTSKSQGILHWKVGINIVNMSLFAQSQGYNNIAHELSKSLSSLGREVKVIHFKQEYLGEKQLQGLGLDKNNEETFSIMDSIVKSIVNDETFNKLEMKEIKSLFSQS